MRGELYVEWIEHFCVNPIGPNRCQLVKLTAEQRSTVHRIYDCAERLSVTGPLAAYLGLLHLAGPESPRNPPAELNVDFFTIWNSMAPELHEYIRRDGEALVCAARGTRWPAEPDMPTAA
jgi:hypothetical protein